jgi:hypothetical protein
MKYTVDMGSGALKRRKLWFRRSKVDGGEYTHRVVRRRGSHIFYTIGSQMAVRLSALRTGRPLPPREISGTHFC